MRRFIHGHLGKMVYRDEFKELPKTDEERRQELLDKMKPWKFDPKRPVFVGGKAGGVETCFEYTFTNTYPFPTGVVYYGCCDETQTTLIISPSGTETICARELVQTGALTLVSSGTSATCSAQTPCPPPAAVEVSISPTGATQYENVVLTASTTGTSPTYIWTLTDFYDTTDSSVSSYTGTTLPEGYFTSTGSSNVSVSVSTDEGNGSTSAFVVSEFDPLSTSPDWWYDTSDVSTITFRTGTNYIEQIDDKSGNNRDVIQTTASYQPLYDTSAVNASLSAATFNGIDERMDYIGSAVLAISGHTTMGVGQNKDKALQPGNPGGAGLGSPFYRFYNPSSSGNHRYLNNSSADWVFNRNYFNDRRDTRTNVDGGAEEVIWYRRENNTGTIDDAVINGHTFPSTPGTNRAYDGGSIYFGWYVLTADYELKLWGEIGEMIHHHRTISDSDKLKIDRYLQYKWFGSKQY